MQMLADVLVVLVALLHVWFLVLEMFLWDKPAGLIWGTVQGAAGLGFKLFFLACVIIAGLYGAFSASRKILWIQALPAAIALLAVLATRS